MLKKTKKLVFALSFLSLAVCAGAGFNALNDMTASAQTANASDLYISAGASVRTDEKLDADTQEVVGYDTGIRFTANASANLIESLVETTGDTVTYKTGAELGMFIVPQSYINDYSSQSDYTDYFDYFEKVKKKTKAQIAYACNAEDLDAVNGTKYRVAIMELLEKNYNRAYQSVAYYTLGGVTYYSAPSDDRTVSEVIDSALQATDVPFIDGQKTAMAGILERAIELKTHAEGTGVSAFHTVAIHGDKTLDLKARFASEITSPDLSFEIVSGDDVIALENGVASVLKADSTAKVHVSAYGGLVDFDVTVRTPSLGETEVIDFIGASDLEVANITREGDVNSITYMDSFQGAQGVLKVDAKNWGRWGFDPLQSIDNLAPYQNLVVRMWIDTTATDGFVYIGNDSSSAENKSITSISSGKWVNYYFNGTRFKNQWSDIGNYYSSLATNRAGQYYIDKIYMTNNIEVAHIDESSDLNSIAGQQAVESVEYMDSFSGANGVVKVTSSSSSRWVRFYMKPQQSVSEYANYKYLVVRMYIDATTTPDVYLGMRTNLYSYTTVKTGGWTDFYFDGNSFYTQWTEGVTNYYSVLAVNQIGTYYIDDIYMTNTLEVVDFDSSINASYIKGQQDVASVEYMDSFNGANGVVKVTSSSSSRWVRFYMTPQQVTKADSQADKMELYADCTYLVVRMYIDATTVPSVYLGTASSVYTTTTVQTGCWVNYYFDGQAFYNQWKQGFTNWYSAIAVNQIGMYYIDNIYVTNTVNETADITK